MPTHNWSSVNGSESRFRPVKSGPTGTFNATRFHCRVTGDIARGGTAKLIEISPSFRDIRANGSAAIALANTCGLVLSQHLFSQGGMGIGDAELVRFFIGHCQQPTYTARHRILGQRRICCLAEIFQRRITVS